VLRRQRRLLSGCHCAAVDPSHSMWVVALQGLHSIAWQPAGMAAAGLAPAAAPVVCPIRNQRQAAASELQPLHRKHSPRSPSTHRNRLPRPRTARAANLCSILQPSTDNLVNRRSHPAVLRRLAQTWTIALPTQPISLLPPATTTATTTTSASHIPRQNDGVVVVRGQYCSG
jgi:hypothetical protein